MKCLITGGAGFIGSYLCDKLIAQKHEVWCVDNLITGHKKNIEHLEINPNFHFLKFDCIKELPDHLTADIIFHFASPASPPKYQKYAIETLLVNSIGTYFLLKKAVKWNAKFIYASTSEVYGDPLVHPQVENYWGNVNPNGERSCYDESKRVGEAYVFSFVRKFNLDVRIIRIFNTYGPRMDLNDGRVITNFIKEIIEKKPLTINGDGKQTRSFCYISDLIEGIIKIAFSDKCKNEVFNIGNSNEITILDLASLLFKITNYKGDLLFQKMPPDDPVRRCPDISKIQKYVNWQLQTDLVIGLKKTLNNFGLSTSS